MNAYQSFGAGAGEHPWAVESHTCSLENPCDPAGGDPGRPRLGGWPPTWSPSYLVASKEYIRKEDSIRLCSFPRLANPGTQTQALRESWPSARLAQTSTWL